MAHSLHRKVTRENVILKVDMAKAYDRVDWRFLQKLWLISNSLLGFATLFPTVWNPHGSLS